MNGRRRNMKKIVLFAISLVFVIGGFLFIAGHRVAVRLTQFVPWQLPGLPVCPGCNIVLISLESLRADELPCYGYERNTMPRLCSFARNGSKFTNFYSHSSLTLDTTFSLMTGLYPSTHHVINILNDELHPSIPTLAQLLKLHGYQTIYAGSTKDPNLPVDRGLGRGFSEVYEIGIDDDKWIAEYENLLPKLSQGSPTFMFFYNKTLHPPYLAGDGPRKFVVGNFPNIPLTSEEYFPNTSLVFFRWVLSQYEMRLAGSDTESSRLRNITIINGLKKAISQKDIEAAKSIILELPPYEHHDLYAEYYWFKLGKPSPEMDVYLRGLYDERLMKLDNLLDPLLTFLERPEIKRNTIVIITSPHGEAFGEKGKQEHGDTINNVVTHVPLIVVAPRVRASEIDMLAQSVDVFPTIFHMVGIQPGVPFEGINLFPYMSGNLSSVQERLLLGEHRNDFIRSVQNNEWKLYKYKDKNIGIWYTLYHLKTDPEEMVDVVEQYPDVKTRLSQELETILQSSPRYDSDSRGFPDWIDKQKRQEIINSGYF